MESNLVQRTEKRIKRVMRIRKHLRGSSVKPRFSVYKSNQHIAAQIIDDETGVTLAGIGTMSKEFKQKGKQVRKSKTTAKEVGTRIAKLAKEKNIDRVVFDRGRFKFHGLIAELANAAREAGLQF
ncbi:MAG: 50S ribosomal protein L18 [Chlamydiales bacterium]|nr:50S ribosomal protein L18 [Chlamydiales bacterium]